MKKKICVKDLKNLAIRLKAFIAESVVSAILTLNFRITIFAAFAEFTLVRAISRRILFLSFLAEIDNRNNEEHNSFQRRNFNVGHRKSQGISIILFYT